MGPHPAFRGQGNGSRSGPGWRIRRGNAEFPLPPHQPWAPQVQAESSCEAGRPQMPRAPSLPRDCPLPRPVLVSLSALLSAFLFFRPCLSVPISVSLCMFVSLCSLSFWLSLSLPLQLSTWLCPSAAVSLCLPVLSLIPSTYLYLAVSLITNASLSLSLSLSSPSHSPILVLFSGLLLLGGAAAVLWDSLGPPQGTALGPLPGHLHMPVTSARAPSSLCSCGVEPRREDTVPCICSGAPGPLTLSATIKGSGS